MTSISLSCKMPRFSKQISLVTHRFTSTFAIQVGSHSSCLKNAASSHSLLKRKEFSQKSVLFVEPKKENHVSFLHDQDFLAQLENITTEAETNSSFVRRDNKPDEHSKKYSASLKILGIADRYISENNLDAVAHALCTLPKNSIFDQVKRSRIEAILSSILSSEVNPDPKVRARALVILLRKGFFDQTQFATVLAWRGTVHYVAHMAIKNQLFANMLNFGIPFRTMILNVFNSMPCSPAQRVVISILDQVTPGQQAKAYNSVLGCFGAEKISSLYVNFGKSIADQMIEKNISINDAVSSSFISYLCSLSHGDTQRGKVNLDYAWKLYGQVKPVLGNDACYQILSTVHGFVPSHGQFLEFAFQMVIDMVDHQVQVKPRIANLLLKCAGLCHPTLGLEEEPTNWGVLQLINLMKALGDRSELPSGYLPLMYTSYIAIARRKFRIEPTLLLFSRVASESGRTFDNAAICRLVRTLSTFDQMDAVEAILSSLSTLNLQPDQKLLETLMKESLFHKKAAAAEKYFNTMTSSTQLLHPVLPNEHSLSLRVEAAASRGDYLLVTTTIDQCLALSSHIPLKPTTYNRLVSSLETLCIKNKFLYNKESSQILSHLTVLIRILEHAHGCCYSGPVSSLFDPAIQACATMMTWLYDKGAKEGAYHNITFIFSKFIHNNLTLDPKSYSLLLTLFSELACSQEKLYPSVLLFSESICSQMEERDVPYDKDTYLALFQLYGKTNAEFSLNKLYIRLMQAVEKQQIPPNNLKCILDGYIRFASLSQDRIMNVLHHMVQAGAIPDNLTYTNIFQFQLSQNALSSSLWAVIDHIKRHFTSDDHLGLATNPPFIIKSSLLISIANAFSECGHSLEVEAAFIYITKFAKPQDGIRKLPVKLYVGLVNASLQSSDPHKGIDSALKWIRFLKEDFTGVYRDGELTDLFIHFNHFKDRFPVVWDANSQYHEELENFKASLPKHAFSNDDNLLS